MATKTIQFPWLPLGTVSVADLVNAKLQLHWAAQIVSAFGNSLLETQPDDSQSNLGWNDSLGALCSHSLSEGWTVGIRFSDLTLLFLASHNTIYSEFRLPGQTLHQAFEWLTTTYSNISGSPAPKPFRLRDYDMPEHPVGENAEFQLNPRPPFQELCHWYANAHHVIQSVSGLWKEASPIRCWPHYFDIATLVSLKLPQNQGAMGSVGCGMSPGDASYEEPYFYVTVWPYLEQENLENLPVGKWHTEGFVGAILTISDLLTSSSPETQGECVHQFFQVSSQAAFDALGVAPS